MKIIKRDIETVIQSLLEKYPILALTGPRQSGKTTLLRNMLPTYQYVSLEDIDQRTFAEGDPKGFLKKYDKKVIFDEVQKAPFLFSYLQTIVDESGEMGQFVLSGSQNFQLMSRITQSLAGRVAICKLLPLDSSELKESGLLIKDWKKMIIKGFYPAIYDRHLDSAVFYNNYLQTYVDRDVTDLLNVHNIGLFRDFVRLCAGRIGQLLNLSSLANQCGITQPTAKSWLSILESSYIIYLLPSYHKNFNKRIVKSPKLYFYDTGLASFLLGIRDIADFENSNLVGSLFENLVIVDMLKKNYHQYQLRSYWFWRDTSGHEVDLLRQKGTGFEVFEIKSTQTILPKLFKTLKYFQKIASDLKLSSILVYGGDESQDRTNFQVKIWYEASDTI